MVSQFQIIQRLKSQLLDQPRKVAADQLSDWGLCEVVSPAGCDALGVSLSCLGGGFSLNRAYAIIDPHGTLFPAALRRLGIEADNVLLVRPQRHNDTLWAIEQALRCKGIGTVLCWGVTFAQRQLSTVFRRFLLAAEAGGTRGIFLTHSPSPSLSAWVDARWRLEPLPTLSRTGPRRVRVKHLGGRMRGGITLSNREFIVQIDDRTGRVSYETHRLLMVSELADSTFEKYQATA